MNFQEKLQLIRKEKNLTQEELAEKLDVSRQAVAKWEAGLTYPEVDNLIALSNLLNVSIDTLLKEDEECGSPRRISHTVFTEEMIEFLRKAKSKCYAGHGAEVPSSRTKSHDLQYNEGIYKYYDSYFGGEKFTGEEVLWIKDEPLWAMNYSGRVLREGFSGKFLTDVLLSVPKEYPYRGPMIYQDGDYSYHCIINGEMEWFQGYEEIFLHNEKVYECYFHGGKIL